MPQAVIEVAQIIPEKHEKHAEQEFPIPEGEGKNLMQLERTAFGVRVFLRAGLHAHVDEDEDEGEIAEGEDERMLMRRARHRVGKDAGEDEHDAGHDGGKDLVERDIARAALVIRGIEDVEPRRQPGAEKRVDRIAEKKNNGKTDKPRRFALNEDGHDRRGKNIHGVKIDLCGEKNSLALFEPAKRHGRKNAEAAGDVRDKGNNSDPGDGHAVHGQKAGIENTGDEHVIKRRHQAAAQADQPAFCEVILQVVDVRKHHSKRLKIDLVHRGQLLKKEFGYAVLENCIIGENEKQSGRKNIFWRELAEKKRICVPYGLQIHLCSAKKRLKKRLSSKRGSGGETFFLQKEGFSPRKKLVLPVLPISSTFGTACIRRLRPVRALFRAGLSCCCSRRFCGSGCRRGRAIRAFLPMRGARARA